MSSEDQVYAIKTEPHMPEHNFVNITPGYLNPSGSIYGLNYTSYIKPEFQPCTSNLNSHMNTATGEYISVNQPYYNVASPYFMQNNMLVRHLDTVINPPNALISVDQKPIHQNTGIYEQANLPFNFVNNTEFMQSQYFDPRGYNQFENIEAKPTKAAVERKPKRKSSSPRKKMNRFDGESEEDVAKKFLADHLDHNLDILIIGINPGLYAAHKGHHYAGPGNHFWKCLFMSEMTPEQFTAFDDFRMLEYGIGFTNIVARTTRGSADLSRKEIEEGAKVLLTKLQYYKPKIAVFNGKGIYEIFSKKKNFKFGKQPETIDGTQTHVWVMPSSSARCSQLPRAVDKVPFYCALKKFRDYLNGDVETISEEELVFSTVKLKPNPVKEEATEDQ